MIVINLQELIDTDDIEDDPLYKVISDGGGQTCNVRGVLGSLLEGEYSIQRIDNDV